MRFPLCLILFITIFIYKTEAQTDIKLMLEKVIYENQSGKQKIKFGFEVDAKWYKKYNPVRIFFAGLMFFYQNSVSPLTGSGCIYKPTCSNYSKDLIAYYGIIPGIILTTDRLSRCNRLALRDIPTWKINRLTGKIDEDVHYYKLKIK